MVAPSIRQTRTSCQSNSDYPPAIQETQGNGAIGRHCMAEICLAIRGVPQKTDQNMRGAGIPFILP